MIYLQLQYYPVNMLLRSKKTRVSEAFSLD